MLVRGRTDADLDSIDALARTTHEVDGYPVRLPPDLRAFLVGPDELAAWVAEAEGQVVGHVALHARCSRPSLEVALRATGRREEDLAAVARLLVSPATRRRGIGRLLLRAATTEATARGLLPVLEVVRQHQSAVGMYEALGWERVGAAELRLPDDLVLDLFVYVLWDRAPGAVLE
jgi:GNAT superfamily N-acetyltransferase